MLQIGQYKVDCSERAYDIYDAQETYLGSVPRTTETRTAEDAVRQFTAT